MTPERSLKILPIYLQPRILSAVSYIHKSLNQEIALENLNESDAESYFIATDVNNAMDKVITLHNEKVANDNK